MDEILYQRITRTYLDDMNDNATDAINETVGTALDSIDAEVDAGTAAIIMFESMLEVLGIEPAAIAEEVGAVFVERLTQTEADGAFGE
jgi:hypothetical protein